MIHSSTIIILGLRILYSIWEKLLKGMMIEIIVAWSVLLNIILLLLKSYSNIYIVGVIYQKAYIYTNSTVGSRGISFWLLRLSIPCVLYIVVFCIMKYKKSEYWKNRRFYDICRLIFCFTIGAAPYYNLIDRYAVFCLLLGVLIVLRINAIQMIWLSKYADLSIASISFCYLILQFLEATGNWIIARDLPTLLCCNILKLMTKI